MRVRTLAQDKAEGLKLVVDKAVLRFTAIPAGSWVQVDTERVADLAGDLVLPAEPHTVCVTAPEGGLVRCHTRRFTPGIRVAWPPIDAPGTRATLENDLGGLLSGFSLGQMAILGDWKSIARVEVDAGAVAVTLKLKDGRSSTHSLDLAGVDRRAMTSLFPALTPEPSVETAIVDVAEPSAVGAGPWPWVLVGTGSAAIAAGAGLLAVAAVQRTTDDTTTQAEAAAAWDEANTFDAAGWALLGSGGALLVGGLVWHFVAPTEDVQAVTADVQFGPDGGSILLRGQF